MSVAQFHLAFPVRDIDEAKRFYLDSIGCTEGRSTWDHVDLNMFGHHVVAHLQPEASFAKPLDGQFDGLVVPVPHFGLNLEWDQFEQLAERLEKHSVRFIYPPHTRLKGRVGEHRSLFVFDPSGNALEFKAFRDPTQAFQLDPSEMGDDIPGGGTGHSGPKT